MPELTVAPVSVCPPRYKLYGRWKNETVNQHPALVRRRTALLKKAKFIMMRITKETIKPVSRGIGKLTHNNPGPIFQYVRTGQTCCFYYYCYWY